MTDQNRLRRINAALSFSPLPASSTDWLHEPGLRLLSEDESEMLVGVFEKLADVTPGSPTFCFHLARLKPYELSLLETFIEKSQAGMSKMRDERHPSILSMNLTTPTAA